MTPDKIRFLLYCLLFKKFFSEVEKNQNSNYNDLIEYENL